LKMLFFIENSVLIAFLVSQNNVPYVGHYGL
jgi:hypothetical protein